MVRLRWGLGCGTGLVELWCRGVGRGRVETIVCLGGVLIHV